MKRASIQYGRNYLTFCE